MSAESYAYRGKVHNREADLIICRRKESSELPAHRLCQLESSIPVSLKKISVEMKEKVYAEIKEKKRKIPAHYVPAQRECRLTISRSAENFGLSMDVHSATIVQCKYLSCISLHYA
jgi:hypothetical protein